jgi:hypothetical protein
MVAVFDGKYKFTSIWNRFYIVDEILGKITIIQAQIS